jgi:hypothetical protein
MRDARIRDVTFADGEYDFRLAWGELAELQEKSDAGPLAILTRLQDGTWRVEDISNIIRLGLIGGGMPPSQARTLVVRYVEDRPPLENHLLATVVLTAAVMGSPEETVGEREAAKQEDGLSTTFPTEKSDLPPSMGPALQ